ncbi:hypothetical protein [Streptomyces parvulus]|uniref:hypothetical protein n=1 Tax=Streptomyces parvulus TaxID=146923 RepID=UPI00368B41C4
MTVDAVDPGPVESGCPRGDDYDAVAACLAGGRRGMPGDPVRRIAWPATDEAARVTGRVVDSESGPGR